MVVVTVLVLVIVGALVLHRLRPDLSPFAAPEGCTATVQGRTAELDLEQAENASLIAAISLRRGLPPRAVSIALATAMQESKLYNIEFGDRDSIGLFQQRPSMGWGTRRQIMDPVHATNRFYDALVQVDGWQDMEITKAAQAVQRSAFPDAYAQHEAEARVLASALTGETTGGRFTCVSRPSQHGGTDSLDELGLTQRAGQVRADLLRAFGDELPLGGFEPGGVTTGHMAGSAHYEGRAVDVFVRPISATNKSRGWAIAAYLVANAHRFGIVNVIFDDRIWTAGSRSDSGWRDYRVPSSSSGDLAILEHRDHVHVDVSD